MSKVIRLPKVMDKTGLPRTTIYWKMERKLFPKQIKLSARSVGWLESEINKWIEQRVNESRVTGG